MARQIINITLRLDRIPSDRITQSGGLRLTVLRLRKRDRFGNTHTVCIRKTKQEVETNAETIFCGTGCEYVTDN